MQFDFASLCNIFLFEFDGFSIFRFFGPWICDWISNSGVWFPSVYVFSYVFHRFLCLVSQPSIWGVHRLLVGLQTVGRLVLGSGCWCEIHRACWST